MYIKTLKFLDWGKLRLSGRNRNGRIVHYHRGGGYRKVYRIIDFKRYIWNIYSIVYSYLYDNIRKIRLVLLLYTNGILSYNLSINNLDLGSLIPCNNVFYLGSTTIMGNLSTGLNIHLIGLNKQFGGKYLRASGSFGRVITCNKQFCLVKLRSRYIVKLKINCYAIVGIIQKKNLFVGYKKASYYLKLGWRPIVRGIAMNPVDHPHGGGQGKTSGGRPSCTPWGFYTKGRKTFNLNRRRYTSLFK